jgi:hypothetical protein
MLLIFAMVFKFFRWFCKCFICIFQVFHLSSFCTLKVLYLNVSKVDWGVAHGMRVESEKGPGASGPRACSGSTSSLLAGGRSQVWRC